MFTLYGKNGDLNLVMNLKREIELENEIKLNLLDYSNLIRACMPSKDIAQAKELYTEGIEILKSLDPDKLSYNDKKGLLINFSVRR
eukprot:UN03959